MAVSHADRWVTEIEWTGFQLGHAARNSTAHESLFVVLNPVGAQRRTNPANLGAFGPQQRLQWVLPVDRTRLTLVADAADEASSLFAGFWNDASAAAGEALAGQVWQPGYPVGNRGVEIGATGTRPSGHPWLSLFALTSGVHLMCLMSARTGHRERNYQAWFSGECLHDLDGKPLASKIGVLNPGDGAIELNHFAALRPEDEAWPQIAHLAPGTPGLPGLAYAAQSLVSRWPQIRGGTVLFSCEDDQPAMTSCDACAGRP